LENINNENYYLKIYVKGKFVNSINLNKLIGRNDDQKLLFPFYRNEEIYVNNSHGKEYWNKKWHDSITIEHDEEYLPNVDSNLIIADKYPTFIHNDTLFIISKDLFLYKIYLKTLKVEKSNYLGEANNIKKIANQNKIVKAYYYQSYADEIIDKDKLNEHFAEILKMKSQYRISEKYKSYDLHFYGFISKIDSIFHITSFTRDTAIPDFDYQKIFDNYKFDTKLIPEFTDKWYFYLLKLSFRNLNDSIAINEKIKEINSEEEIRQANAFKDTINGIYIPKDLYDAMDELDKIVPEESKKEFKELENPKKTGIYHFTGGMSIRNKWGLWINSRLAKYFESFGIYTPDQMSTRLLISYWYYLHDSTDFILNRNFVKFKLDSNLILFINRTNYIDTSYVDVFSWKKINQDKQNKFYLTSAFPKSELVNYLDWNEDSTETEFYENNMDYSLNDYVDSLINYKNYENNNMDPDTIDLSSSLFINYLDFNFINFIESFYSKMSKIPLKIFPIVDSYLIVNHLDFNSIDSLDYIFTEINKKIRADHPKEFSSDESEEHNAKLIKFLKGKQSYILHVIKFYPLIQFDFKKYKQEKKNK
jgi:hypothetical protein